jgi:uncharacterized protein YcgL (UPF0745 family)
MKVDIYRAKKSPKNHEKRYIFVLADFNITNLPPEILENTGELVIEKTIDIKPGEKRIALDTDEALKNINEKGYHEQITKIEVEIKLSGYILYIDKKPFTKANSLEEAKQLAEPYIKNRKQIMIESLCSPARSQIWIYDHDAKINDWVEQR